MSAALRFHLLKPEYIHQRIRELQRSFRLRVLLCYVDVDDVVEPLAQVIKAALLNDCTLICGWSPEVRSRLTNSRARQNLLDKCELIPPGTCL